MNGWYIVAAVVVVFCVVVMIFTISALRSTNTVVERVERIAAAASASAGRVADAGTQAAHQVKADLDVAVESTERHLTDQERLLHIIHSLVNSQKDALERHNKMLEHQNLGLRILLSKAGIPLPPGLNEEPNAVSNNQEKPQ